MSRYNHRKTLITRIRDIEKELREFRGAQRVPYSSIPQGGGIPVHDGGGNLVSHFGAQVDGTFGVVDFNGPKPCPPTDPVVYTAPGLLTARWDGGVLDDGDLIPLPLDFSCVQVLARLGSAPDEADVIGVISSEAGGLKTSWVKAGTWYVRLRTRTRSGRVSDMTETVIVEVPSTVSPPEDTGWLDIPLSPGVENLSGYSSQIRKIGDVAYARVYVSGVSSETVSTVSDPLPEGFWSGPGQRFGEGISVDASGVIHSGPSESGTAQLSFQYLVG